MSRFLKLPNSKDCILNYGDEEAFDYVCQLLLDYINNLELSCYRQDFNAGVADHFIANDEENRCGITEIKHIMGLY